MNVKILRRDIFVLFCVSKVFYYYIIIIVVVDFIFILWFFIFIPSLPLSSFLFNYWCYFLTIVIAMKKPTWRDLQLDLSNKFQLHKRIFYIFACFMLFFFSKTSTFIYLYLQKILKNIHQVFTVPSFSLSKVFNINFDIKKRNCETKWHEGTNIRSLNY